MYNFLPAARRLRRALAAAPAVEGAKNKMYNEEKQNE